MKRKLTQAIAREYIRLLGGKIRKDAFGDLRVKFGTDEYFTTDLHDAIGTARIMAGGHEMFSDAEKYLADMGVTVDDRRV